MWKINCRLVVSILVTAVAATADQPAANKNRWLPSLQYQRPARSVSSREWMPQDWHSDIGDAATSPENQAWSADTEEKEAVPWKPQEPMAAAMHFEPREIFDSPDEDAMLDILRQQINPQQLNKRQPPRRLGSLVDLYKDLAHGLSPFVVNAENELLPAKPERRSGRRPAACRFGPFGLVCWNAARRGAVMRQRSAQYTQ